MTVESETTQILTGVVKWFDPVKGYGFIVPSEGGEDVLLHMSALKASGFAAITEGARIVCEIARKTRGIQAIRVIEIEEIDLPTAPTSPDAPESDMMRPSEIALQAKSETESDLIAARVKWFDKLKGFGFVNLLGDAEDVFIHMETLRRYGMPDLDPGEAILVRTVAGPRGRMASEARPWEYAFKR